MLCSYMCMYIYFISVNLLVDVTNLNSNLLHLLLWKQYVTDCMAICAFKRCLVYFFPTFFFFLTIYTLKINKLIKLNVIFVLCKNTKIVTRSKLIQKYAPLQTFFFFFKLANITSLLKHYSILPNFSCKNI